MAVLLQLDFPYQGPWGEEMSTALKDLADSINQEDGFIWKIWTENEQTKEAGGVYLFEDRASAKKYLEMHTERMKQFGVEPVNAKFFEVNKTLSLVNQASFVQDI